MQTRLLVPALLLAPAALAAVQDRGSQWPTEPVATIRHIEERLEQGDATVLWDQLPPSYQRDVNGVVDLFAEQMDPDVWNGVVGLVVSAGELLTEQRTLILDMLAASDEGSEEFDREQAGAVMAEAARYLSGFRSTPFGSLESLAAADLRQVLGDSFGWLLEESISSGESFGDFGIVLDPTAPVVVELAEREGDRATVRVGSSADQLQAVELRLVESKWVLAEIADTWDQELAEAREGIQGMFAPESPVSKSMLLQLIGTAQGVLDDLTVAETAEEFENSAKMGMFTLMGAAFGSGLGEMLMQDGMTGN